MADFLLVGEKPMRSRESIIQENADAAIKALQGKLKKITSLLEIACEHLERSAPKSLEKISDGALNIWWLKLKKAKADNIARQKVEEGIRLAAEEEIRERIDNRNKVLAKLTPQEKKILGVE